MDLLDNDVGGLSHRPVISSGPTEPIAVPYLIMPQTTIIPHPPVSSTLQSLPSTQVLSLSPSTDSKSSHSKTRDGVTNPANMEHHKKQIEEVVRFLERHEGLIDEEKMYLVGLVSFVDRWMRLTSPNGRVYCVSEQGMHYSVISYNKTKMFHYQLANFGTKSLLDQFPRR